MSNHPLNFRVSLKNELPYPLNTASARTAEVVVSVNTDRELSIFKYSIDFKISKKIKLDARGTLVEFSKDGTIVVIITDRCEAYILDINIEKIIFKFKLSSNDVWSVAFNTDSTILAMGSYDGIIRLYNVATGLQVGAPLVGNTKIITSVAFNNDSDLLVSGGWCSNSDCFKHDTGFINVWNIKDGHLVVGFVDKQMSVRSVGFNKLNQQQVISINRAHIIKVWDITTESQKDIPSRESGSEVKILSFDENGILIK